MVPASLSAAVGGWPDLHRRSDPFAELLRAVAADPDNAYNLDPYVWVLEEGPLEPCEHCGAFFDSASDYAGGPATGKPRRYCSRACSEHAAYRRRRHRELVRNAA
jgi:hypothetical protein